MLLCFPQLSRLEIDEAVLTGESVPVIKTLPALNAPEDKDQDVAIGDRTNMAFRQTSVAQGSGKGIVAYLREGFESHEKTAGFSLYDVKLKVSELSLLLCPGIVVFRW